MSDLINTLIKFFTNYGLSIAIVLFILSAITSIFPNRYQRLIHLFTTIFTAVGSIVGFIYAIIVFLQNLSIDYSIQNFFNTFEITFSANKVNAIFLAILFFVSFTSITFGYSYVKHYFGKYRPGFLSFSINIFLVSMIAVLLSQSIFSFIFCWEMMSISSFFVIIFENDKIRTVKAGIQYLVFTQIGVLFIIAALLLLSQSSGSQAFGGLSSASESTKTIATILLLIGFGAKAGLIPLHIWLPEAHPAAPSHASALISGVMLKVALFAMIEFFFIYIPLSSPWLGIVLIIAGVISAVLGSMYSFVMNDIKKLIAYSSIDNIGIITMLMGVSLLFSNMFQKFYLQFAMNQTQSLANQLNIFSTLFKVSFVVMIFHTINHAIYKSALFQSTGVINNVYGTKDINKLGGIARALPFFSILFIILAAAISAMPPLNGFASEWLSLQTMISGILNIGNTDVLSQMILLAASVGLIFTGAITAAAFVKVIGVGFLGLNRENKEDISAEKKHIGYSVYASLTLSVIATVLLGIFSNKFVELLSNQIFSNPYTGEPTLIITDMTSITSPYTHGTISTSMMFLIFVGILVLTVVIVRLWKTKIRKYLTWDCGRPVNSRMQYSAIAFADNLRMTFPDIYFPKKERETQNTLGYKYEHYSPIKITYKETYLHVYEKFLYNPISKFLLFIGNNAKKLQTGVINTYLVYILVTLIILLLIVTNVG